MINGISLNNRSNVSFGLTMGEEAPRPTKKENSDTFTTSKPKHAKQAPKSNGWAPWQKAVAVLGSFGVGATAGAVGTAAVIPRTSTVPRTSCPTHVWVLLPSCVRLCSMLRHTPMLS